MDKNYIVTKSNNLINCNYDLSLQEQKIILTLASMVQPQDENFKPYIFKIKDFMKLLGIDNKSKYTEIPKITKELMQKVFEIKKGNKVTQLSWLSSAEYEKGTGMVELEFSPKLKPYMLGLKEFYTSYKLGNVLSLKSKYSVRLYEILKSNLYRKYIEIEVEEFKNMVGSKEKAYKIYNNFKNRILIRAQKELAEKTDVNFTYQEIKTGRKVTSIKFCISTNKTTCNNEIAATLEKINPKLQQNMDDINLIKEIIHEPITDVEALKILISAKGDINIIKEKYSYSVEAAKIENMVGWIIDAIKNDYKSPKGKVNKFNNYEQREYDFEELEKKLLGWK
ncbi:replication initiation protein [Clostridium estertheticum]|uniref:replication initiation protein n=1 Tax=Clostridium estertheticum TaxID=238834 RepID=UPI001C7D9342|nr:replication initiation protein [Clostridium estertheticum]MBX4267203.1 replication initiation protein [Clostridium estertheticum]WLC91212.1 replication initiation protein [Clostridium estertheticum]